MLGWDIIVFSFQCFKDILSCCSLEELEHLLYIHKNYSWSWNLKIVVSLLKVNFELDNSNIKAYFNCWNLRSLIRMLLSFGVVSSCEKVNWRNFDSFHHFLKGSLGCNFLLLFQLSFLLFDLIKIEESLVNFYPHEMRIGF